MSLPGSHATPGSEADLIEREQRAAREAESPSLHDLVEQIDARLVRIEGKLDVLLAGRR